MMISRIIKTIAFTILLIPMNGYAQPTIAFDEMVVSLSVKYTVKAYVLDEFIESYNFKCPDEINETQIRVLLNNRYTDHQLNIMIESDALEWRDIYVEARSDIICLTEGEVSKGY